MEFSAARTILTAPYRRLAIDASDPRIAEGLAVSLRSIEAIARRCRTEGVDLLVVLIPTKETVFAPFAGLPERHVGLAELLQHEAEVRSRVVEFAAEKGIDVVDVTSALRHCIGQGDVNPYWSSPDGHPSAVGHGAIGSCVARHMAASGTK
jgi:hypothetical protein